MAGMKILVTGGAGFIGSHLTDGLVGQGHDVVVLDSLDPQVHPAGKPPDYLNSQARFVQGDIRDPEVLRPLVCRSEAIFHLASAVSVGQSQYEIARYVSVNSGGTANLLNLLANEKHTVRKLIVAASMSSYGEGLYACPRCGPVRPGLRPEAQLAAGDWHPRCPGCALAVSPLPTPEEADLHSNSIYAVTKKNQEEMCLLIGKTYGIPVVSLRYFNVYGPRQSLSNPYNGVAAIFLSRIKNGQPPVIYEDGAQSRDFISVHDVVEVNLLALESCRADGRILNVGSGRAQPIREVAETLSRTCGKPIEPEITGKYRKGDVRHCFAENAKLLDLLGFRPRVSFEQGVAEMVSWSTTARALDLFHQATAELVSRGLASR